MLRHRAIISVWIDDCEDSDEAMRFVRLYNAATERIQGLYGKRITITGMVAESQDGAAPEMIRDSGAAEN